MEMACGGMPPRIGGLREFLLAIDKDAEADAAPAAGRVVDSRLRLEAAPRPIEPIAQPRGAVHSNAFQVQPPAAAQCPPVTLRSVL